MLRAVGTRCLGLLTALLQPPSSCDGSAWMQRFHLNCIFGHVINSTSPTHKSIMHHVSHRSPLVGQFRRCTTASVPRQSECLSQCPCWFRGELVTMLVLHEGQRPLVSSG
ncbi:hypothetical protein BC827DRAFT_1200742 [Russula dissimulans]|nr:hypothetical protein BC827DRAFT_1200742 [Russula dissimulans]